MPATPAASKRKSRAADTPADLKGKRLLCPPEVFPEERTPKDFPGWKGRVVGADRVRDDGPHVFVKFEDDDMTYHFPVKEVRSWVVQESNGEQQQQAEEEQQGAAAEPPPRKQSRKASSSSRTPATSKRRTAAAAVTPVPEEGGGEDEAEQPSRQQRRERQQQQQAAPAPAGPSPTKSVRSTSRPLAPSSELRKCKVAEIVQEEDAVAAGAGEGAQQQEDMAADEQPSLLGQTVEAVRQTVAMVAATATCYGLLRVLYPLEPSL